MFELLVDAVKAVFWLLGESLQYLIIDLMLKPMKARTAMPVLGSSFEEAVSIVDPCQRGEGSADYYSRVAELAVELAESSGARTDRQRAAIIRTVLEEFGCDASRTDIRLCARALGAYRRSRKLQ